MSGRDPRVQPLDFDLAVIRTVWPNSGAVELAPVPEDAEPLPSSQRATPPCEEHVPEWCVEKLYVPSLH